MFEDAIVDFFETADIDKDGVLSYDDYCTVREKFTRSYMYQLCMYVVFVVF